MEEGMDGVKKELNNMREDEENVIEVSKGERSKELLVSSSERSSPTPAPRSVHSSHTIINARYSVDQLESPDHQNDDRCFIDTSYEGKYKVFGIFDGHDGSNASEFACSYMQSFLRQHLADNTSRINEILREMFEDTDRVFFKRMESSLNERGKIKDRLKVNTVAK